MEAIVAGVAGRGGMVPKRSDQRRRQNKVPGLEKAATPARVVQPRTPAGLHVRAGAWYRSLASSGQAQFYTDSDWQVALICAHAIDMFMETGRATLLAEIRALQSQLLTTEGERRRARLELTRAKVAEEATPDASDLAEYRRRSAARSG